MLYVQKYNYILKLTHILKAWFVLNYSVTVNSFYYYEDFKSIYIHI